MHPEISRFPSKRFYGGKLLDVTTSEMVTRSETGNDALVVAVGIYTLPKTNIAPENGWL